MQYVPPKQNPFGSRRLQKPVLCKERHSLAVGIQPIILCLTPVRTFSSCTCRRRDTRLHQCLSSFKRLHAPHTSSRCRKCDGCRAKFPMLVHRCLPTRLTSSTAPLLMEAETFAHGYITCRPPPPLWRGGCMSMDMCCSNQKARFQLLSEGGDNNITPSGLTL